MNLAVASGLALPAAPLAVEVVEGWEWKGGGVKPLWIVNLQNRSETESVTGIEVVLTERDGESHSIAVSFLAPLQSRSVQFDSQSHDREFLLTESYFFAAHKTTVTSRVVARPSYKWEQAWAASSAPAVAGTLLSTLLGALIVHLFTARRDVRRLDFEWRRMSFDKYEPAYRAFLAQWSGRSNGTLLRKSFGQLRQDALLPDWLVRKYDSVQAVLDDPSSTPAGRDAACAKLLEAMDDFVSNPWAK